MTYDPQNPTVHPELGPASSVGKPNTGTNTSPFSAAEIVFEQKPLTPQDPIAALNAFFKEESIKKSFPDRQQTAAEAMGIPK